jgi:hypothetical protein
MAREARESGSVIERILIALLTQLGSAVLSWVIAKRGKKQIEAVGEAEIDARLVAVKAAYSEALDGKPVTKEQREKINRAISDFIRGGSTTGL